MSACLAGRLVEQQRPQLPLREPEQEQSRQLQRQQRVPVYGSCPPNPWCFREAYRLAEALTVTKR